jgi:hypothetical protein
MDDFFTIDQPTPPSSSNGLPAQAWLALGAIDPRLAEPLLESLRSAGVGAYVAPFTSRRSTSHLEMRLWVDAALKSEAERVVSSVLPELRESLGETEDERWSQLVASLQSDVDPDETPWPVAEGYSSFEPSPPPPPPASYSQPVYEDPEDHFVPPDPAPLPPTNPVTKYGWVALLGGIALLIFPALAGHAIGNGLLALAILAIMGGFVTLVLRMKDAPPNDSDPDDGAVV